MPPARTPGKAKRKGAKEAAVPQDDAPSEVFALFSAKAKKQRGGGKSSAPPDAPFSPATGREGGDDEPASSKPNVMDINQDEEDAEDTKFKDLGLTDWLCSVCGSLGMKRPTPVQRACIPAILAGKDTIGTAQTGSGKTAAFALPILQTLSKDPYGIFALVLTPTRELAFQIGDQFRALGAGMSMNHVVVVGGVDHQRQAIELARRPHIVIATPGRLQDQLKSDPTMRKAFSKARFLVFDEADRMLDQGFEEELATILDALPEKRQTLLFSATITKSIAAIQEVTGREAFHFRAYEGLQVADNLRQEYMFIPAKVKEVYLTHMLHALEEHNVRSVMVFVNTCRMCQLLQVMLEELGFRSAALHAQNSQGRRLAALEKFKSGLVPILLATDVASRGLDIPTVDMVVNFDLPVAARDYVHRVGRTARAGRRGWALSLVTQYDVKLVHEIEGIIEQELVEHAVEEADVLKGMTAVYTARRLGTLKLSEAGGFDEQASEKKKRYKANRLRKEAAKNGV